MRQDLGKSMLHGSILGALGGAYSVFLAGMMVAFTEYNRTTSDRNFAAPEYFLALAPPLAFWVGLAIGIVGLLIGVAANVRITQTSIGFVILMFSIVGYCLYLWV